MTLVILDDLTRAESQDDQRVCKFYGRHGGCWLGVRCPYKHVNPHSGYLTHDQRAVFTAIASQFDFPKPGSNIAVEICAIFHPGHFYVNMPWGPKALTPSENYDDHDNDNHDESTETLEDLLESMSDHYNRLAFNESDLVEPASGELVAARYSQDNKWYRARVIDAQPEQERVKVLFIDFGNSEWRRRTQIQPLEAQFIHLPEQAVECFLHGIEPMNGRWTAKARKSFLDMTDGKTLVIILKNRSLGGCISVELYDTFTGGSDLNIGLELVNQHFAVHSSFADSIHSSSSCASSRESLVFLPA